MKIQEYFKEIYYDLIVVLAAILLAFNYQLFIVENNFAPAGLNGIATMIQYKTGFSIGYMSLLINVPLCILAFFLVNKNFAKRTLVFCLTYSFVFLYLQKIGLENFQYKANGHDTIYPVVLSGVLSGIVYGICFRNNSSTGGTDIVSKYISKRNPSFNFFRVTFILNAVVAVISFFVYAKPTANGAYIHDYKPVCLCLMYCFISTFVGDLMIKGTKEAVRFTIITTHPEEIIVEIREKLKHSVTKVTALGSYTNNEKTVLFCVVNRHQMTELQEILSHYPDTFSFSEIVSEVYGNFKHIHKSDIL